MGLIMGSLLSEPVTEKESADYSNERFLCGASSMQGWRVSQEDAHNCILDYDTNTSFFAVYDGHGGHEVAQYCSQKLPDFIKDLDDYKEGKIGDALTSGFLKFDALIATPEVVEVLKKMADEKQECEESDVDEEENIKNLYEEAAMPIEQVIEKYTSSKVNLKKDEDAPVKAKKDKDEVVASSASCSSSGEPAQKDGVSSSTEADTSDKSTEESKPEANGSSDVSQTQTVVPNSSEEKPEVESTLKEQKDEAPIQNGEISTPSVDAQAKSNVTSSTPVENGTPSKKGKGKAVIKPEPVKTTNTRPKRTAQQLYKNWLDFGEDSEDSDEEDDTFEGPKEESSEDEGDGVNVSVDASEDSSEEGEDANEEDLEDDDDDDDEDEARFPFRADMTERPGVDSGCTAVVALLKGNKLYVANAGDSRCVVCRNGKAVAMSLDHKPEDEPEMQRIVKAGGEVFNDGRVNGGLNLSRAIGDHAYKKNKELSDREQMITALPDIKTLTIDPTDDEFMVLACDGIWNSMSNQEVVDFVKTRLQEGREKLSQICEEMFDHCLAPSDGMGCDGCDNMTSIIVKFKSNFKRAISPQCEENTKRAKTESDSNVQVHTTV